jgi:hypothetical protein
MKWEYQQGYIWIADDTEFGLRVWIDPTNFESFYSSLTAQDWHDLRVTSGNIHNIMANCEAPEGCGAYESVIHEWRKLGSPRIDRKAPGYEAPAWTGSWSAVEDEHERQAAWIEENPEELFEGVN